jgi:eight-cysteine-cluster-containing protein
MNKYYAIVAVMFIVFIFALIINEMDFSSEPPRDEDKEIDAKTEETSTSRRRENNVVSVTEPELNYDVKETISQNKSDYSGFRLLRNGDMITLSHIKKMDCGMELNPEINEGPDFDMYSTNIIEKEKGEKEGKDCYFLVNYTFGPLEPDYYNFRVYDYSDGEAKEVWQMASIVPENASFQVEEDVEEEEFCGISLKGECKEDEDCIISGCQDQVCQSAHEKGITTSCAYEGCYIAKDYNMSCQCVEGKCAWALENSE